MEIGILPFMTVASWFASRSTRRERTRSRGESKSLWEEQAMGKYLNQLAFMMLGKEEAQYNAPFKEQFKKVGVKAMRELAKLLDLPEIDIHFNRGGIAVSGDLTLIGMWSDGNGIYISMNKDFPDRPWGGVLYRTVKHMKDYTGGSNNYFEFALLQFPEALKERVLKLRKGGKKDGEDSEGKQFDDYAHTDVRRASGQRIGSCDQDS